MEKTTKYIVLLAVFAFAIPFILNNNSGTEKTTLKTSFLLGNKSGFDLNPNELTFGRITQNGSASRDITITNNHDKKRQISIQSSGEIKKYIIVSENNFYLNPKQSKNITFSVYASNTTEFRKYSGQIIIISK